jgi:hypothetical protein
MHAGFVADGTTSSVGGTTAEAILPPASIEFVER